MTTTAPTTTAPVANPRALGLAHYAARGVLEHVLDRQLLVADGAHLRPADAGRELIAVIGAETAPITARIWGGIPAEDLAAAGRVLALVTERANAELAALTA